MGFQREKLRELLLFVARRTEADERCGKTKLFKLLFYSDFKAYRRLRAPITGATYIKQPFGPVPFEAAEVLRELVAGGEAAWAMRPYHGLPQKKLLPLREASLELFSAAEIDLVHQVVQDLWRLNGRDVSDLSHEEVGWQMADPGEEIPYGAALLDNTTPILEEEMSWISRAIEEHAAARA